VVTHEPRHSQTLLINGIIFLVAVWHYTSKGLKISIPGGMKNLVSWALRQSLGFGHGVLGGRGMLTIRSWGPVWDEVPSQPKWSTISVGLRSPFLWLRVLLGSLRTPQPRTPQFLPLGSAKPKVPLTALIIKMGTSPGLLHLIFTDSWSECY